MHTDLLDTIRILFYQGCVYRQVPQRSLTLGVLD